MKLSEKFLPSLLIAVGIAVSGLCIKSGMESFAAKERVVSVRGLAEREVKANKVTWPIQFKVVGDELNAVYNSIQKNNAAIIEFLKQNGVKDDEISVNAPDLTDMEAERYVNNIRYRYNVSQVIVVVSNDVDKISNLIMRQTELLKQGVAIAASDYQYKVSYEFTELNSIKPEMIAEATKAARIAGEQFAKDSDSELGKIKKATQGQFSIENRDENTPYIKKVRVVSYVEFFIED